MNKFFAGLLYVWSALFAAGAAVGAVNIVAGTTDNIGGSIAAMAWIGGLAVLCYLGARGIRRHAKR